MIFMSALLLLVSSGVISLPPFVPQPFEEALIPRLPDDANDFLNEKEEPYKGHRWANRTLYYFVDDSFYKNNSEQEVRRKLDILQRGLKRISRNTCINFVEDGNHKDAFKICTDEGREGPTGFSTHVGTFTYFDPSWKYIWINDWKDSGRTAIHEMIHALGFHHTQHRLDRDDYVIDDSPITNLTTYGFVPYDMGSIMHYDKIQSKDPKCKHSIRSYRFPSFLDIKALNILYDCQDYCPEATSAKCQNGGYPNPRDCSKCNCPFGYGGHICDQRPKGCGEVLNSTDSWQTVKWTVKSNKDVEAHVHSEYQELYTVFCTHWIQAPLGRKIEVKLGKLDKRDKSTPNKNGKCEAEDGIEIKILADPSLTNPRNCMNVVDEIEIETSALNPTPVISWTGKEEKDFEITFRHVPEMQ